MVLEGRLYETIRGLLESQEGTCFREPEQWDGIGIPRLASAPMVATMLPPPGVVNWQQTIVCSTAQTIFLFQFDLIDKIKD